MHVPPLTQHGKVRYELKTPCSDDTTHVLFEPLDFIFRLVALVPKPRVNFTRYHGVLVPNSKFGCWFPTSINDGYGSKAAIDV